MQRRYREIHGRFELDMGWSGRDTGDPDEVQRDPEEMERDVLRETYGRWRRSEGETWGDTERPMGDKDDPGAIQGMWAKVKKITGNLPHLSSSPRDKI
jgi:hypothetical protein